MNSALRQLVFVAAIWAGLTANAGAQGVGATTLYTLAPGDELQIDVFREPDLSGRFEIDSNGLLRMPLIGALNASGATVAQLRDRIIAAYARGFLRDPQVSIDVLTFRPFFILGEVNDPGAYPFQNGLTVLSAVALADGFSFRAHKDRLLIRRAGDATHAEYLATDDTLVFPGDVVIVPERFF